jgi:hypothetical protein
MKNKVVTAVLTILFLGVMFGGLFNMSMGMNMTGNMADCPFMEHGEVLCAMNVFDHFSAWESAFMAIVPTLVLLLSALAAVVALVVAPNLVLARKFLDSQVFVRFRIESVFSHSVRPLQELFSNGILHPKLF